MLDENAIAVAPKAKVPSMPISGKCAIRKRIQAAIMKGRYFNPSSKPILILSNIVDPMASCYLDVDFAELIQSSREYKKSNGIETPIFLAAEVLMR